MDKFIAFFALLISITFHEFSHAFVADRLGDPTPRSYGRLTLNPAAHADLLGTIILPLLGAFTGLPTIGWAKPVPIDRYNLQNPRRDEMLISLAGPASNFLLAIFVTLFIKFTGLYIMPLLILILINISLAVFNLIPIPPLDGSKILLNLLPADKSYEWEKIFDQYGLLFLILFLFIPFGGSTLVSMVLTPVTQFILSLLKL
ncbi:MAG TPA: site-2 protease family protein [Patescibacteria group bacterium]